MGLFGLRLQKAERMVDVKTFLSVFMLALSKTAFYTELVLTRENHMTDIQERIRVQKRTAEMATGGKPIGLMLGEDQMVELQCVLQQSGMPLGDVVTEYDGMKISRPAGVDGIVIVVERIENLPSLSTPQPRPAPRQYIGAHPILF